MIRTILPVLLMVSLTTRGFSQQTEPKNNNEWKNVTIQL
jgi:hypothetical protein